MTPEQKDVAMFRWLIANMAGDTPTVRVEFMQPDGSYLQSKNLEADIDSFIGKFLPQAPELNLSQLHGPKEPRIQALENTRRSIQERIAKEQAGKNLE